MAKSETRQFNYPEIVLGRGFKPFTVEDVDNLLKRRKTNPDVSMGKHFNLDKFPIIIFIESLDRLSENKINSYASPFGNVIITQIIGPDGRKTKTEGFAASVIDNYTFERPPQSYAVTVEINGEIIEGSKTGNSSYRFRFGQWGSEGFLIPEKLDLSELEYTFVK